MKISDPQQFLSKLDKETYQSIESRFGKIDRFLAPGDKFRISCGKLGDCCRDREDNPIMVSAYDAHRLRQHLGISGREFADKYGKTILGTESQLPLMILRNECTDKSKKHSQCIFLKENLCSVYKDRPLVCRLYPVGRAVDPDLNSYFFLTKTSNCCQAGCGREHTIENWLKSTEVEPYTEWNDRFNELYMQINHEKYKALDQAYKAAFGNILYDIDAIDRMLPPERLEVLATLGGDARLEVIYELARQFAEMFLKE